MQTRETGATSQAQRDTPICVTVTRIMNVVTERGAITVTGAGWATVNDFLFLLPPPTT